MKNYDVIIIGGGAAGFAAASFLSLKELQEKRILIIEKNRRPMNKLAITGKGRCNLTNNCDIETVLRNIHTNPMFMRSALAAFSPADTMAFFESLGVPLKTERGGRVFPVSDRAEDVVDALRRCCERGGGVEIINDRACEIVTEEGCVRGVRCTNGAFYSEKVILATGGMSYPKTGSTGDGYAIARKLGHTVTPLKPALVPLETAEVRDCSEMAGLTLKNVVLTMKRDKKILFKEQGELLFTHFGVSGPLVLTASCFISKELPSGLPIGGDCRTSSVSQQLSTVNCQLSIDIKPALDEKTLDERILKDFSLNKNRLFKNSLSGLLPQKMTDVFVRRSGIDGMKQVNEITKQERYRLLRLFKEFPLTVTAARSIDEAVITDGGVSVKEIDPKTMQSKLVKGLYFAGEVIDVCGFTGGFNLQIAFSTAYAAGMMTMNN